MLKITDMINHREKWIIRSAMNENIESLNKLDTFVNGKIEKPDSESMKLLLFIIENWIETVKRSPQMPERDVQIGAGRNLIHKIKSLGMNPDGRDVARRKNNSER